MVISKLAKEEQRRYGLPGRTSRLNIPIPSSGLYSSFMERGKPIGSSL
jgi:uncharacterized membrane protein